MFGQRPPWVLTRRSPAEPNLSVPLSTRGVNFSVFSRHATAVELLLFNKQDDVQPMQTIKLEAAVHQTFFFWHVYVKGLKPGTHYGPTVVDGSKDLHGQGFASTAKRCWLTRAGRAVMELHQDLAKAGIVFALSRLQDRPHGDLERMGLVQLIGAKRIFDSRHACIEAYRSEAKS
jgi:predicted carbohydrate-binding protein with CBM48